MRGDAKDVLARLVRAGVELSICIPDEYGSQNVPLSIENAVLLLTDPVAVYAKLHAVGQREFRTWRNESMSVRCSAKTLKGKRCRNIIGGGRAVSAVTWADLTGGYCHCHGDAALP